MFSGDSLYHVFVVPGYGTVHVIEECVSLAMNELLVDSLLSHFRVFSPIPLFLLGPNWKAACPISP